MTKTTREDLKEALRTVLRYATLEEGQMWEIRCFVSEDLFGKLQELCE